MKISVTDLVTLVKIQLLKTLVGKISLRNGIDSPLLKFLTGSAVCLTRDRGAVGSSLTGVTVLCP